ncbi:L-aspartate oxidase [Micrococcales bacterium 31B]|nr:L-aspartate oxidase [Micrococcales bacterium 31B]
MAKVLVIGTGIAGITAALASLKHNEVTVVTKGELGQGSTEWAQGGIAAEMSGPDGVIRHAQDTLTVSGGIGDANAVRAMCFEAAAHVRRLQALGVQFDREGEELARGLEGAHSNPRVLHAGGDATGAAIQAALNRALRAAAEAGSVELIENHALVDLIVDFGRVAGAVIAPHEQGGSSSLEQSRELRADVTVLATGGAGQMYSHTTNPLGATGDGIAAAYRAGAELVDLEFYQFHPTYLAAPEGGPGVLISEAVRGAGGTLLNTDGARFMQEANTLAELAARDVVARSIVAEMLLQPGTPVMLDARPVGDAKTLAARFPTIDAATRTLGYDWSRNPIPVSPAAHFWMGGIATDSHSRSSLPGLLAVGEAACTGVHGANRIASNSLLEGVVYGERAAFAISRGLWNAPAANEATVPLHYLSVPARVEADDFSGGTNFQGLSDPENFSFTRAKLQKLMWQNMGVFRTGADLQSASNTLEFWRQVVPAPSTVGELEDLNLLELAFASVHAALARAESRGAHYRVEYPHVSKYFSHRFVCTTERPFRAYSAHL